MKKLFALCALLFAGIFTAAAQLDTIFTHEAAIPCNISEITESAAKFKYPGEEHDNSLSTNAIRKIVFRSGRVQEFASRTAFKRLDSPESWQLVSVTGVESEIKGLYKIDDVSSKAKGTTEFSNQERVKRRAIDKMKMQAAILGANIIYMVQMRTDGNKTNWITGTTTTAETSLYGAAYSSQMPNFGEFTKRLGDKTGLNVTEEIELTNSDSNYSKETLSGLKLNISRVYEDSGLVMIEGSIPGCKETVFRVTYCHETGFYMAYKSRRGVFSYKVSF